MMAKKVPLFIDGRFVDSEASEWIDVTNPATNEVIARCPVALPDEVERAIASAKAAQQEWRQVALPERPLRDALSGSAQGASGRYRPHSR